MAPAAGMTAKASMEISVTEVGELPANTYLSVRYGDSRKQAPFVRGESFVFPAGPEKAYTVDVFRKVGTRSISLAGMTALGGTVESENLEIPSLDMQVDPLTVSLRASLKDVAGKEFGGQEIIDERAKRHQVAVRAKSYLDKHDVQPVMQAMFARLLERLPSDPLDFMIGYLEQQRQEIEDRHAPPHDFSKEPGLGDAALPGFGDREAPPKELPDLQDHHSLVADVLRQNAKLYANLSNVRTPLGVSFSQCIKPGIDCPGHELVKVSGAYAGDFDCYEVFQDLFNPVISSLHNGFKLDENHMTDMSPMKLSNARIDPTGRYAVFATLETRRNISSLRLPTCCSREERREVERLATRVLIALDGDLKGHYYPLRASQSYPPKVGGMTRTQEEHLRRACALFAEPDSRMRLSAGLGRHWPDARGIYVSDKQNFFVWCNEEDHLRFVSRQHTVDIKAMWSRVITAIEKVEKGLEEATLKFLHSDHLGFITTCPSRLGTALRVSVSLKIPLLAGAVDLQALCRSLHLQSTQEVGSVTYGSVWNVSNCDCLGVSEVDILNSVTEGCAVLVMLEQRLEAGEPIYDAIPGLGAEPYPGFPADRCPARLPDLSSNRSLVAQMFQETPDLYKELHKRMTSRGVSLAACIKPGMDNPGLSGIEDRNAGLVAGDEESYETFRGLFDPVINRLHSGFTSKALHPVDTTASKLSNATIDPNGALLGSLRLEMRRNLRGLRLAPCCDLEERREVERVLVKALLETPGSYMPLTWSKSYVPRPSGMLQEEQAALREQGVLFPEPAAVAQLSAGLGRHWPDARGIFMCNSQESYAWINAEDHACFIITDPGSDVKGAYCRMSAWIESVEAEVSKQGLAFMQSDHLGYVTVSPENLGCALRCSVSLRLFNLAARPDFLVLCEKLELQATWHAGAWEIANRSTLGVSEVDLVSGFIEGCALLVNLEEKLLKGESISPELRQLAGV
mmetsp:Transcript_100495/g.174445  ORF Transcript_100495/g.174445 Transcript_100495/m.174445 type:complete len:967 (+) Transcript_100495:30-2930(+)